MSTETCLLSYAKPREICREPDPELYALAAGRDREALVALSNRIHDRLAAVGLRIRAARPEDCAEILALQRLCVNPQPGRRYNSYELYRLVSFTKPLVLTDAEGRLMGYDLAASYAGGTAVTAGYALHPSLHGSGLSRHLLLLSMILALGDGAQARRGIVEPHNTASLMTMLNHLGFICDSYVAQFMDFGEPRLTHGVGLSLDRLLCDRISPEKLAGFLKSRRPGIDYRLVRTDDHHDLEAFAGDGFCCVACLPPSARSDVAALVALPIDRLTDASWPKTE